MDANNGRDTLRSLNPIDSMMSATLFNAQGHIFASWRREGKTLPRPCPNGRGGKQGKHILIAKHITKNGQFLGTLLLHSNSSQMTNFLINGLLVMALLFLFSTLVSLAYSGGGGYTNTSTNPWW